MTKAELLKELSTTLFITKVQRLCALAESERLAVNDLLDYSFYPQKEIAFRAAWVLEYIELNFPQRFVPVLDHFLAGYQKQHKPSCQRHYTKIMMRLTEKSTSTIYQFNLRDYNFETIVDTTFEWLINPKTPIAVKVNCIEILVNLRKQFDWIEEELKAQIVFLLKDGGPAIQSRGKRMLKVLSRGL
ncbi:MAG: hypothetical protein JWN56_18 [Sphingobacteriales bacterium]|nr:hypothetical protein [Sphingobacteriales bacterium]